METKLEEALGEEQSTEEVAPEVIEAAEPVETGEKEQEATPEPEKTVPLKALEDERQKRQELDRRLAAIENQQPAKEPEPLPDMWENTQEWQERYGQEVVQTAVQQASQNSALNTSEMLMRQQHDDFDAVKDKFIQMANENPVLGQKALSDPHPWNFAYRTAKNAEQMEQLGATNIDEMREAIKKELAEEAGKSAGIELPPTTATQRNVSGRTGPSWSGPTSLEAALGET